MHSKAGHINEYEEFSILANSKAAASATHSAAGCSDAAASGNLIVLIIWPMFHPMSLRGRTS